MYEVKTNSPQRTKVKMKYMITDTTGDDDKEGKNIHLQSCNKCLCKKDGRIMLEFRWIKSLFILYLYLFDL